MREVQDYERKHEHIPEGPEYGELIDRFYGVVEDVYDQANGAAPDPYMQAFYQRLVPELTRGHDPDNEFLLYTIFDHLKRNPYATAGHTARALFQTAQYLVIPVPRPDPETADYDERYRQPDYPVGRDRPEGWDDVFAILKDEDEQFGRTIFNQHLVWELIQSNDAQRGLPVRVAAQLFGLRKLKMYSGGCSMGLIEKLIGLGGSSQLAYHPISMGYRGPEGTFEPSATLTEQLGRLATSRQVKLGPSVGVDLAPPTFSHSLNWAWSNTMRPSYLLEPDIRQQVERLMVADVPNLKFSRGDFTLHFHPLYLREQLPRWERERFNLATFVTSLYQNDKAAVLNALNSANKLTSDDGIIVVQDFAHRGKDGQLRFVENWRAWDYNLFVWDKTDTAAGWQHIFSMRDPRVMTDIAPGEALQRKLAQNRGQLAVGMMRTAAEAA